MEKDFSRPRETTRLEWTHILNSTSKHQFEQILHLIRLHYGVDAAFFSLADEDRQRVRASQGLAPAQFHQASALCDVLVQRDAPLIIPDVGQDARFGNSGAVPGQAFIRFYAGVPLRAANDRSVGALCLSDKGSRQLDRHDMEVLRALARLIEDALANGCSDEATQPVIKAQQLTRAISNAQTIFLATDDDHAAFEALLDDVLTISECAFGFIGEVRNNESGQPYVKVRAITNISWDDETARLYDEVNKQGMIFDRLDNLIGAAVVNRDIVISENVPEDRRRGGTPRGHPHIATYMGIPVFSGTNLVGLIGLANRPRGFSKQFARDLEPLTRTVGTLIERKRLYAERTRQHERAAERAAKFDVLTGLPNRRLFTQIFDEKIREANVKGHSLSVCLIDLDGFKQINDRYGHETGDAVLKDVAKRLSGAICDGGVVARLSGDEFVALLPAVNAPSLYERLLECIEEPISHCTQLLEISGSMGITRYPADNSDRDVLLRHADQAMYAAKELGKNRISIFDVGQHRLRKEKHKTIDDFQTALSENELELFYQPKIDLHQSQVVGFEALIRWHHPKEGLLTPDRFLPALAYSEQEIRLGEYVLSEGVKTVQHFAQIGADYSLCINISAQHILHDDFLAVLEETTSVLAPALRANICIEVLESMALKDIDLSIQILAACKRLGISLSLDDFGTGFSSLSYFRQLPVDEVKIDKTFVREVLNDPNDWMIAQNIVNLAKGFNRKVVGEGVETLEVAEELIKMGCDYAQGYYFTRPLPLEEAINWSRKFGRK